MRLRHAALPPHGRSMHTQTQNHRFQHLYTTCNIAGNDNMLCMVPCMLVVPCSFAVPTIPYRCTVHRSMWACCDTPQAPRARPAGSQALNPTSIYRVTGMHKDLWCLHEGVYTSMPAHPPNRHVPEIPHADCTCLRPRRSKPAIYTSEEPGFFILCPARLGHINDWHFVHEPAGGFNLCDRAVHDPFGLTCRATKYHQTSSHHPPLSLLCPLPSALSSVYGKLLAASPVRSLPR